MGVNEYARHRGVTPAAIEYAISRGYVARNDDGLIDAETADEHWDSVANPAQAKRGRPAEPATIKPNLDFANARATKEQWACKLKELEYKAKEGLLISREQVEIDTHTTYRKVRDALLNLPNRLAAQLAAETDPFLVQKTLEAEIRLTIETLTGIRME